MEPVQGKYIKQATYTWPMSLEGDDSKKSHIGLIQSTSFGNRHVGATPDEETLLCAYIHTRMLKVTTALVVLQPAVLAYVVILRSRVFRLCWMHCALE
jgi:hypothetical protein